MAKAKTEGETTDEKPKRRTGDGSCMTSAADLEAEHGRDVLDANEKKAAEERAKAKH